MKSIKITTENELLYSKENNRPKINTMARVNSIGGYTISNDKHKILLEHGDEVVVVGYLPDSNKSIIKIDGLYYNIPSDKLLYEKY